jgi:hypothetical protein
MSVVSISRGSQKGLPNIAVEQTAALGVALRIELESFRMDITSCTKADYDQIVTHIQEFWGSDRTLNLHHPLFVYEFGNSAYIINDENQVAAYQC